MRTRLFRLSWPALLALPLLASYGGWAAITVPDLPDYAVARQPLPLTFTVRQHGVTPLSGLQPRVAAVAGGVTTDAVVAPAPEPGQYTARLAFPDTGEWTVTIHSGFGASQVTLLPLTVIAPGAAAPAAAAPAVRGRRLFVAKGCVSCHLHRDVSGSGMVAVGPELTGLRLPADFLERFLADPSIAPPTGGFRMPNLNLTSAEIAALVAFLSSEPRASR